MKPFIFVMLIASAVLLGVFVSSCRDPHTKWLSQYVVRTKFLPSIANAMYRYEESHNGEAPKSLEELRPILETIDPEGLRDDSMNGRLFDRAVLFRNIRHPSGTHYEWIVAVLLDPKIREKDPDIVSFADKYVTNGQTVKGLGGAFLPPGEMEKFYGRELVQEVYRKHREVRGGTTLPAAR